MKLLFLTSLFPNELRNEIRIKSKGPIANANDSLQWAYVEGLSSFYKKVKVLSVPNIGAFPLKYRNLFFKSTEFRVNDSNNGECLGFFNFIGLKHFSRYFKVKRRLSRWLLETNGDKTIIIYDLYSPFLLAAHNLKKIHRDLKICLIVPDLIGFTGNPQKIFYRIFEVLEKSIVNKCLPSIDSFVLLSKHMAECLPIENKPFVVVEGIFHSQVELKNCELAYKLKVKTIFYSGSLDKRNGILGLLYAFMRIKNNNYTLIICGDGDCKNKIKSFACKDSRIIYKGQIDRAEVMELQRNATLLVNPRTSEGQFTKFSFPSKTMEYLASGVPTLIYKLDGIPVEYYDYCYFLEDNSIDALATKITEICEQSFVDLNVKGKLAQEFVVKYKNPKYQVGKMLDMLRNIH